MSRNLILYVDGSQCPAPGNKQFALGWGLVALHNDKHHEASGSMLRPRQDVLNNYHEAVAFIEGVLYAHRNGFDPRDVTLYTDCQVLGYAPVHLHPGNYSRRAEQLLTRIQTVAAHAFDRSVVPLVLDVLQHGRIIKVKGHSFQVYNERVDYLARHAARKMLGEPKVTLSMEDWLVRGIRYYAPSPEEPTEYVPTWWHAPFVDQLVTQ